MIVSNQRFPAVRIRTDDADRVKLFFFQRKDSVVFQ